MRNSLRWLVPLFLLASPVLAQRELKDIPDPDPEIERQSFEVAEGLEVNLFAADPLIKKPIQMSWDAAGRLWVATSETYPHIEPGQRQQDKIVVLEDRDQDGQADKTTVFADGLLIPTGIVPGDGGVYVANSTELLHLADTDGDGRADRRTVVLSGFGTEDTHHIIHSFRFGPDGSLYFNQSIYIHSHIETPWGVRRLGGGGIWRLEPRSLKLDVYCRGFVNPWGHIFDAFGQSFATDGAYGEGINYVFPGSAFVTAVDAPRILKGLNPGSPKHCGLEITSGRHLPDDWQGNLLTNDFRGHRVCRFVLSENNSSYASREQPELIKTAHVAFRPIDIKMGPDGAIYVADWYNPIIQHGEVDFRDERRDHTHGRIWRVTAKGRPLVAPPRLVGVPTEQLLAALELPEGYTREHAKRVLHERGAEIVPAVSRWIAGLDVNAADYDRLCLEGLWTLQGVGQVDADLLRTLLSSHEHRVRAAAVRVLFHQLEHIHGALDLLSRAVEDDHPRVRLEAVRALSRCASPRAVEVAMRALDHPVDDSLDFALWQTARDLEKTWLPRIQSGELDFDGRVHHLTFALAATGSPRIVAPLTELLKEGKIPADRLEGVLSLVASLGEPADLALVFDLAVREDSPVADRAKLIDALAQAARQRKVRPEGDLTRVSKLLTGEDSDLRAAAARAVGLWRIESLAGDLKTLALDAATGEPLRRAALEGLTQLDAAQAAATCRALIGGEFPGPVRMVAVAALADIDVVAAAASAAKVLGNCTVDDQPETLFAAFLSRKNGAESLAANLADKKLPKDVARVGLRVARGAGNSQDALIAALTAAGEIAAESKPLSPKEMQQLVRDVAAYGDPARGEALFRRQDQQCFNCHAIGGAGGRVGPDMISLGASAPVDYLVNSLLQPNDKIKENYHTLIVTTSDGEIFSGVKVRQTDEQLILRDKDDKEIAVPLAVIDEQGPGRSLMPEGMAETLTRAELIDLVRFLSELGKVGPYQVSPARLVRRWETLLPTEEGMFVLRRTGFQTAAAGDAKISWGSLYGTVAGELPLSEVPKLAVPMYPTPVSFVRCELEVSTPGAVKLLVNDSSGLTAWLGPEPLTLKQETTLDLPRGRHRLTIAIDRETRHDSLRLELMDVKGSAAQAEVVGGK